MGTSNGVWKCAYCGAENFFPDSSCCSEGCVGNFLSAASLGEKIRTLQTRIGSLAHSNDSLRAQLSSLRYELRKAQAELQLAHTEYDAMRRWKDNAERKVRIVETQLAALQGENLVRRKLVSYGEAREIRITAKDWINTTRDIFNDAKSVALGTVSEFIANQKGLTFYC